MTWIKFALWLLGIYTFYYTALIVWDMLRGGRTAATEEKHELTFVEHIEPIKSLAEALVDPQSSPVVSHGGLSLKQMFNVAREEGIEYIRQVSY